MEERTVGPYRVLRRIGDRGGMAVVYLAEQQRLGRVVALKELDLQAPDPKVVERFIEEARIAGSLRHPNIVAVHDFFEFDGVPYISMEFVERGSLRRYVGTLTPAQTFGVLEGVLAGLTHAHAAEVIHRDLKPENLLVSADGAVKIADFGIARALRRATKYTGTGITVGTPAYMAPEQAMALKVTPATDLHSVGVIAFELLSGQLPMSADAPMALMLRKVHESSPFLHSVMPSVDPRLNVLIGRLLARVPDDRPQSARETWDEFEEIAVSLLGPFWRREARLPEPGGVSDVERPLEPASFEAPAADFVTFKPGPVLPEAAEDEGWTAPGEESGWEDAVPPHEAEAARREEQARAAEEARRVAEEARRAAEAAAAEQARAAEAAPPREAAVERPVRDPWAAPEDDPRLKPTQPPATAPTVIERVRPVFPEPVREKSQRVWWIVGGVGVAVVLALATVFAVAAVRQPSRPVASATPSPTASPTPTPSASPSPSPSPSPTPSPTATSGDPDEQVLVAYVDERVGPSAACAGDPELPEGATARVRCELPGKFPATYTQFETLKTLKAYVTRLSKDGEPENLGRCAAEGEWFGDDDEVAGRLIGRRVGGRAVLSWSDEPQLVAAYASSARSDRAELCSSWESYG